MAVCAFAAYNLSMEKQHIADKINVRYLAIITILLIAIVSACSPAATPEAAEPLPTLYPTPTPAQLGLAEAERTARAFLAAWANGDYATMYSLVTTATQEALTQERFTEIYEDAANTMTLRTLSFEPRVMARESAVVALLNYDVTFETNILGEFSDTNRDLRLVLDRLSNEWRVAWSPGDIFPEMGDGAILRFVPVIPRRANIYDRDGDLLADQNGRSVIVYLVKQNMPDAAACLNTLASVFEKTVEEWQEELAPIADNWTIYAGDLEPGVYEQNRGRLESDCAATFQPRFTRRYLRGTLAPHILGHVGYISEDELDDFKRLGFDAEAIVGRSGIERSWDATLRGQPGGRLELVSPQGERIRILAEAASRPAEAIWLTIDTDLQLYIQTALAELYANALPEWRAQSKGAAVVVMDVHTGEILAMVSWPTYDGNALTPFPFIGREAANLVLENLAENERRPQLNRVTQGQYPAGSTFKLVDAIAVTDSGIYALDEKFNCSATWSREENFVRYDWSPDGQGILTLTQAIARSCNTYFYEVGWIMDGIDPFLLPSYAHRFGFGESTGLRDLSEGYGTIPDPDWLENYTSGVIPWRPSDTVDMAIGQGYVEITPLQLVRFVSMIANDGTLYRPQLVSRAGLGDTYSYVLEPDVMDVVELRAGVLETIRQGMCEVTTERYGTARHVFRDSPLETIGVCGKTGTAQNPGEGVEPHSWFAAYAPREEPQIAIVAIVENGGEGSQVAAPLVRRILEYYFGFTN